MNSHATFASLVNVILDLINSVIPLLAGVALVLFLFGGLRYIYLATDTKSRGHDKEILMWGLVALFVLFSIWGIVRILQESLLP